jgi:hypothetical protein
VLCVVRIIIIFYNKKGEKFKMNNKFKRALSSILAFIMLVSCLCVMNVSSVFAATAVVLTDGVYEITDFSFINSGESNARVGEANNISYNSRTKSVCYLRGDTSNQVSFTLDETVDLTVTLEDSSAAVKYDTTNGSIAAVTNSVVSETTVTSYTSGTSSHTVRLTAGDYVITGNSTSGNSKISGLRFVSTNRVASDGTVSLAITNAQKGTTTVTVDGSDLADGESVEAEKDSVVVISATPNSDCNVIVKINDENVELTNNSYSFTVDGDAAISVEYSDTIYRTAITETVVYNHTKEADELVLPYGGIATKDYYFDLTSGAKLEATKRIDVNGSNGTVNGILFSTGDLTGKTATLKVHFAPSGGSARTLKLMDVTNGSEEEIGTTGTSNGVYLYTDDIELNSETEYCLKSKASGLYIDEISITVTANEEPTVENVFTYKDCSVEYGADNVTIYVIGSIRETDAGDAEEVGFFAGLTADSATDATTRTELFSTDTVANMVVNEKYNFIAQPEAGTYFAAGVLTDEVSSLKGAFYVVPFTKTAGGTALGEAVKVSYGG